MFSFIITLSSKDINKKTQMLEIKLVKIYTNLTSGRRLKITRWIYAAVSLSSFWGQLNEYPLDSIYPWSDSAALRQVNISYKTSQEPLIHFTVRSSNPEHTHSLHPPPLWVMEGEGWAIFQISGEKWHFSWGWFFSGGYLKTPL